MKNWLKFCSLLVVVCMALIGFAQNEGEVKGIPLKNVTVIEEGMPPATDVWTWTAELIPGTLKEGGSGEVRLTVKIKPTYHLYALHDYRNADGEGPQPTEFKLESKDNSLTAGAPTESDTIKKFDANWEKEVQFHEDEAVFTVPLKAGEGAKDGKYSGQISVTAMACNDEGCIPAEVATFEISPDGSVKAPDPTPIEGSTKPTPPPAGSKGSDLLTEGLNLTFILTAIGAGLGSLFTPCVFPMIPITVSFFSKQRPDGTPAHGLKGALAYCLGIILTFTGLGLIVSVALGATGMNDIANNPWLNIVLATLFIVLSLSLFGVFELAIPAGLANKLNQKGQKSGGLMAPLLMGFAFSITSFTCTGPFVGAILGAAAGGSYLVPVIGMLLFSVAFCIPFFLLARFPGYLANLPKSGSWLSTVKVFMGFLEIAAALKFLSIADVMLGEGFFPITTFLAVLAAILTMAAFYLLGWIKMPKDGEQKIGIARRSIGGVTLASAAYCLLAINGTVGLGKILGPLCPPDPFPYNEARLKLHPPGAPSQGAGAADKRFIVEEDLKWWYSFDDAKAEAKKVGKPIMVDFTGYNCTNCRYMERNMFPNEEVNKSLKENFVLAKLYTDRVTDESNKVNRKLMYKWTQSSVLPGYVIVTPDEQIIAVHNYDPSQELFMAFLAKRDSGLAQK